MVNMRSDREGRVFLDSPNAALSEVESLAQDSQVKLLTVDHGRRARDGLNMMQLGQVDRQARDLTMRAAECGFVAFAATSAETRFVRLSHVPSFWTPCLDGTHRVDESGLIYSLFKGGDRWPNAAEGLLVVLSSMSAPWNKSSLTRYFEPNFASVDKHVPDGIAVLRIADLDGVVGGFYMSTVNHPERERDVVALVSRVAEGLGVPPERVLLYGASKGGTAALNLGLKSGFRCVAVDPVVADEYYEGRYNDSHWTAGAVFLQRKRTVFAESVVQAERWPQAQWVIVSGTGSPLFEDVAGVARQLVQHEQALFLVSDDGRIKDHPDVSPRTLRTVTGLINTQLQGLVLERGERLIFG